MVSCHLCEPPCSPLSITARTSQTKTFLRVCFSRSYLLIIYYTLLLRLSIWNFFHPNNKLFIITLAQDDYEISKLFKVGIAQLISIPSLISSRLYQLAKSKVMNSISLPMINIFLSCS